MTGGRGESPVESETRLPPISVDRRAFLMSTARLGMAGAMFAGISLLILRDPAGARATDACIVARDCAACDFYPRCIRPKARELRTQIEALANKVRAAAANTPDAFDGAEDEQFD